MAAETICLVRRAKWNAPCVEDAFGRQEHIANLCAPRCEALELGRSGRNHKLRIKSSSAGGKVRKGKFYDGLIHKVKISYKNAKTNA